MKQLVKVQEIEGEGLEGLLGQQVLLMCGNYFYTGKLVGVNDSFVKLNDPAIVYETGPWANRGYSTTQKLHVSEWYIQRMAIESFGLSK